MQGIHGANLNREIAASLALNPFARVLRALGVVAVASISPTTRITLTSD
jgi:hypothetical protein